MINKKTFLILFSILFSIIFSYQFLYLTILNVNNEYLLNIPSWNSSNNSFYFSDIKVIFSFSRRASENLSIFEIGSNIHEINYKYHYLSSRGLGFFINGFLLNFFQTPINVITINYLILSFLNFYIICLYFKDYKLIYVIFFTLISILFGSKVFGGVLNPFHYFEYFKREMFDMSSFYLSFYTALHRIPNILINNIFIFIIFFTNKKFFFRPEKKFFFIIFLLLLVSTFLDPIIFIIYLPFLFFIVLLHKYKNNISIKIFYFYLFLIFFISSTLIFHFYNYNYVIQSGTERHGIGLAHFWMGNSLFSYEMIIFPIFIFLIFFNDLKKYFLFEFYFLIIMLLIYIVSSFLFSNFFASRITHRNFEILIACISYSIIFKILYKKLITKKIKILAIFFILHLIYVFLQTKYQIFIYYFSFLILFLFFLYLFSLIKKKTYKNFLGNFLIIIFAIYFFISLHKQNSSKNYIVEQNEIEQMKFFNWSNQHLKRTIISLDLGFILNNELHTNNNVYISSILNSPSAMNRNDVIKRMNDIFYLYGFSSADLKKYLQNYNTIDEINNKTFDYKKNNIALLNEIIFYENFQVNYNKNDPINLLLKEYENYLKKEYFKNINFFDTCVITNYDDTFIKNQSFFSTLKKKKPIYKNLFLSVYECKLND